MIKRYKNFVNDKVNEEFVNAEPEQAPAPSPTPTPTEPRPETPPRPRPERPGITPIHVPSEEDAPLAISDSPEEEEDDYIGTILMHELANKLGVKIENNSINYNGKKINFYSETEKFHVDNKKFETPDEVIEYLDSIEAKNESKSYKRSRFKF
jgi:hypothetical protein